MSYVEKIQSRLQLKDDRDQVSGQGYVISQQSLAIGVGYVVVGLPVVMFLSFLWSECSYDSISHYYYSRITGDLFVGALFFIGAFLLAYRSVPWVTWLSTFAGFFAFGVALFPTSGAGCTALSFEGRAFVGLATDANHHASVDPERSRSLFELFPDVDYLHFGSAAVFFVTLAFFCFFVFTRILDKHRDPSGTLTPEKALRNKVYIWCGRAIVAALAALAINALFGESWDWWDGNKHLPR